MLPGGYSGAGHGTSLSGARPARIGYPYMVCMAE